MTYFQGHRLKSLYDNRGRKFFKLIEDPFDNGYLHIQGMISFKYTMPPLAFQDLFLNVYMVIFGIGISVFILSLIFCCCFISKLQHQAQWECSEYKVVVYRGETNNENLHEETCAVCLEDFTIKDELGMLPCQHGFHKRCLTKWLEVRCTCPMCNKPIAGPTARVGSILDELV